MISTNTKAAYAVRPYREGDEKQVLDLLEASLGGGPAGQRTSEFFRWKHLQNPFGRSLMLLAEADGQVIGLRAFMRWQFRAGDRTVLAVRAVDTATHPSHQGEGIFRRLTLEAIETLRRDGTQLIFNTPNGKSLPGYLKMGWSTVGAVPVSLRIKRPGRFLRGLHDLRSVDRPQTTKPIVHAARAGELLSDEPGSVAAFLTSARPIGEERLATPRDTDYLRWRYGSAPALDYRGVRIGTGARTDGLGIFRVRARGRLWESTVAEVIVRPNDRRAARAVFGAILGAAEVDHVACHVAKGSAVASAARRKGFLRAPSGIVLVANPVRMEPLPDPTLLSSWLVSLGDLEVF